MDSSGSEALEDSFARSYYLITACTVKDGNFKISYGDGEFRHIRSLGQIRHNRDPKPNISSSDIRAAYNATLKIVDAMKLVTVQGGHDCAGHIFRGDALILSGGDGGAFTFVEPVSVDHTGRTQKHCALGAVPAYNIVGAGRKGRIPRGVIREKLSGLVWLLGSGKPESYSYKKDYEPAFLVGLFIGAPGECIYAWDQGAIYTIDGKFAFSGPPVMCGKSKCRRSRKGVSPCPLCRTSWVGQYGMIYPAEIANWYTSTEIAPGKCLYETTQEYTLIFDRTARKKACKEKSKLAIQIRSFAKPHRREGRVLSLAVTLSLTVVSIVMFKTGVKAVILERLPHTLYAMLLNQALGHKSLKP